MTIGESTSTSTIWDAPNIFFRKVSTRLHISGNVRKGALNFMESLEIEITAFLVFLLGLSFPFLWVFGPVES